MERHTLRRRVTALVAATFALVVLLPAVHAQQADKKAHAFKGKVMKVDAKGKTLTVDGEDVAGWMSAMTMSYKADKDDVYQQVKTGDVITATVYDGDFTTLHDVKVVPPPSKAPPAKK